MNLHEYLQDFEKAGVVDHTLRCQTRTDGSVGFCIQPSDVPGHAVEFVIVSTGELLPTRNTSVAT